MNRFALHGFARGPSMFAPLEQGAIPRLDLVTPWLLGHGPTPPGDPSTGWDGEVARVRALLPPVPLTLIGYSMGARLALAIALAAPTAVTRLVLIGVQCGISDPAERASRRGEDDTRAVRLERHGLEAFLAEWESLPHAGGVERADRRDHRPAALAAALRVLGPGAMPDLWPRLPGLAVPADLVVGARDPKFVSIATRATAAMPRARLHLVPDAGHDVVADQPARVRAILEDVR